MTWTRILTKVRVVGRLSLMRAESAERLYKPGGAGATAAIGRFGPYIKLGGTYLSLKGEDDVLTIGLNRAVHLLADAPRKDPPREIGLHPKDKKPITQREGRWGPYVQHGRLMATLPKGTGKDAVTLEEAVALLNAKAGKKSTGGKGGAKKSGKKKAASSKKAAAANGKKAAAGG